MTTITKKDLALAVRDGSGCPSYQAARVVDFLFAAMREELSQGNRIEIRGFGVVSVKATAPKPAARNPRTGEIISVPGRRKTHFKPGRELKEGLNEPQPPPGGEKS